MGEFGRARAHRGAVLQPARPAGRRRPRMRTVRRSTVDRVAPRWCWKTSPPSRTNSPTLLHPLSLRSGQLDRRAAGRPARHLLVTPPPRRSRPAGLALHAVRRRHLLADRLTHALAAHPSASPERTETSGEIPIETAASSPTTTACRRCSDRHSPAHGHARRRPPGQHVLPRRQGGPAGLAGGAPRAPRPRTGLTP